MAERNRGRPIVAEIAGIEKDIYQDYIGRTILNPDKILRSESSGRSVELYEDLLRDEKVGSSLQTRKLSVVGREWEVIPASPRREDRRIADYVTEVLKAFNYDAFRMAIMSGLVIGFKPAEIMWDYSEGNVWIREIIGRAAHRFVFDVDRRMRLITLANMVHGEELPDRKFVVFRNPSDTGSPYGDGLGRMLYWPVWFKKNAIKFWMIYSDKFGSPTAVGKYPPGTAPEQQAKLLSVLEAIQQESVITIPDNIVVDLLEATRGGSGDNYEALCKYMNGAIAQVILGQTLTSEIAGTGTYAASKTHEEVRQDYIKADADALCACQNESLIKWIVDYNFPSVKAYPTVWIRTDPEQDLKGLAERDKILAEIGLPIARAYFYETYNIPAPKEGEETVERRETGETLQGDRGEEGENEFAAPTVGHHPSEQQGGRDVPPDLIDAQDDIDLLGDDALARGGIDLSAIEWAVEESESYEDLQLKLAEAYHGISVDRFRAIMEKALFLADIRGRTLQQ